MSVLVIAEHDNSCLNRATLSAVSAARQLKAEIDLLVAGHRCSAVVEAARRVAGIRRVLVADSPSYAHLLAESVAPLIAELGPKYSHILATTSSFGRSVLPGAAALLDVQAISDVLAIESETVFIRPQYAGDILARIESLEPIKVLLVRATAFAPMTLRDEPCALEVLTADYPVATAQCVAQESFASDRPALESAAVVVSGGKALGSADHFQLLHQLADRLGGAVGATRAAVDAGYAPNELQIGQTGKVVAPDLYIAVGVSGAVQHLAGMKDSKVVVAINLDPQAPIFDVADYGLVGDLFEVVPRLTALLARDYAEAC